MKLDNETQRTALLKIINQVNFTGANAEFIVNLKIKIAEAALEESEREGKYAQEAEKRQMK